MGVSRTHVISQMSPSTLCDEYLSHALDHCPDPNIVLTIVPLD